MNSINKNDLIINKRIKVCSTSFEVMDDSYKEILYAFDPTLYTKRMDQDQTFFQVKKNFMQFYQELLRARREISKMTPYEIHANSKEYYKQEGIEFAMKQALRAIIEYNIDVELLKILAIKQEISCKLNQTDLEFLQLVLLYRGITVTMPGIDKERKRTIFEDMQK